MKWIVLILLVAAIGVAVSAWLKSSRQTIAVTSPVERIFVYQKRLRQTAPLGFFHGLVDDPLTGRGRTDPGKQHLKMGIHSFIRPVIAVKCSSGQYAITFWSDDEVSWKAAKGSHTQGPIPVKTADLIPAKVALRASYAIIDSPDQLLKIQMPEAFAERAIADVLVATREAIGRRDSLDYATIGREDLSGELFADIDARLKKRGLVLRDLWLGNIEFDPEVQQAIKNRFNAMTLADIPRIAAGGQAVANRVIAESVSPQLIELIRAERSGNPWNYWVAHMAELEGSPKSLQR